MKFLSQAFEEPTAPLAYRLHRDAAEAVLKALLPPPTSAIRGISRSASELREVSGYTDRAADFAALLHILDQELRLIVTSDLPASRGEGMRHTVDPGPGTHEPRYQLAHDYLIRQVRQWIERKQHATRAGRARLRLELITASWVERPGPRHLPSVLEWAGILRHTRHAEWTEDERRMMRAATRHYTTRAAVVAAVLALGLWGSSAFRARERAQAALQQALKADFRQLPALLPGLLNQRTLVRDTLERLAAQRPEGSRDRQVAELLLYQDRPSPQRAAALAAHIPKASPDELEVTCQVLSQYRDDASLAALYRNLSDVAADPAVLLRKRPCALAQIDPQGVPRWPAIGPALGEALLAEDRRMVPRWLGLLGPAAPQLIGPLSQVCRDPGRDATTRTTAAEALAEALIRRNAEESLVQSFLEAQPESANVLLRELAKLGGRRESIRARLLHVLAEHPEAPNAEEALDHLAECQATAAIALAVLGEPERLWPQLRHHDDPRQRSLLIEKLASSSQAFGLLCDRLSATGSDPVERQGLLMVWAEINPATVGARVRAAVQDAAGRLYLEDASPGVHAASELLMRRWGETALLARLDALLSERPPAPARRWRLGPNGHTWALVPGPMEFLMGSPPHETRRFPYEERQYRRIDRSLEVATKEVTVWQYRAFKPGFTRDPRYTDDDNCPVNIANWFDAVAYCNFLSERAGIPEDQWCYPRNTLPGMALPKRSTERPGYRLPTEAEWEYLCRAGTVTAYPFGGSDALLAHYGCGWSSGDRTWPVGQKLPNEFGLFDMVGNVWEWCHDGFESADNGALPLYPRGTRERPAPDDVPPTKVHEGTQRYLRGGAFCYAPAQARSAHRYRANASYIEGTIGFRVVRTVPPSERKLIP